MASLRDADMIAILGEDYARKFQSDLEAKPKTAQEREAARKRDIERITDLRISLVGAVLAGAGLLVGPYVHHSGLDIQAICGIAAMGMGVIGFAYTITRKRSLTLQMSPAE